MFHTRLTSKGQVTVPQRFRRRMKLTGRRSVVVDQLADGAIVIRPAKSILHLAGSVPTRSSKLTVEEERHAIHDAMIERHRAKSKKS
jgi:bifunctional DNA-binding transcriptional regulator/antitoxin component of YhaV-PrlF toxin-antitoxin module